MADEMQKLSFVFIDNPGKFDSNTQRKFKVVSLSSENPEIIVEAEIYLEVNWFTDVNMVNLDTALKAVEIKRRGHRIYWQAGLNSVLPIFNYITLSSAVHTMAFNNNFFYFIQKDQSTKLTNPGMQYRINQQDKDLILRISAAKMNSRDFTGYTRFEETIHRMITCASREEHLPVTNTSIMTKESKKPDTSKTNKSPKSPKPKSTK